MAEPAGIVIAGAGFAGGNAAVRLRKDGFDGPLSLIGVEPDPPFGRPPLSKTYLRGEEDVWWVRPPEWYPDNKVELIHDLVERVDPREHRVGLRSGRVLTFQRLLITTGGRNRRLNVPGTGLAGVHQLRTRAESDAIKAEARPGAQALVVGMSFIGSEVAASLRQLGLEVTAVLPGRFPMERVLGPEVGEVMAAIHRDHGVRLVNNDRVARFEGSDRLALAVTENGERISCDLAVVGVGIEPEVEFLEGSGIAVENGILVDELCRTSVPGVFAAGDVANHLHPIFGRIRVEHYNNGEKMARAAARSMLDQNKPYGYIHSFWSDQFEHKLEYSGYAETWDRFVVRGSLEERKLVGFYLKDGVLRAAMGLDRGGDPELEPDSEMAACARLIAAQARVSEAALADESVELKSLS
jgi:3-phenylpropionate/trans-cinnamate dioxygenase ferredoxin reductase subunit